MNKKDILKTVLAIAGSVDPRIALAEKGFEHLIHRDDDPTNDVQETADALGEIVVQSISIAEDVIGKDVIDNAVLADLKSALVAQIVVDLRLVRALKIAKTSTAAQPSS